ncbi:MAG TPA: VOC family protein [Acidimicrobiia bacterium]|nr:VOC family protein [Acidimicrobiia bacterium]
MAVAHRVFVTLDCVDPAPLAEFWAAMLGGEIVFTTANAIGVRSDALWLAAMRVADYRPPTWPTGDVPKQAHLDLGVTDLDAAAAEAERLGARPASFQPEPDRRRILLDPAGHPFCLTTQIPREAS